MASSRSQQGARRRSGRGARGAATAWRATPGCPGCTARSRAAWSSGSRRSAHRAAADRRVVGRRPAAATSFCAPPTRAPSASPSRPDPRGRRAGAPASDGPGGRSARRARVVVDADASDAEIGRAQLVWANMALHLRRRSAGAVRALARAARGRGRRRLLLPGPGHAARAARALRASAAGRRRRPATSTCTTSATCSSMPASPTRCSTRRRSRCAGRAPRRCSPSCASSAATPRPIVFAALRTPAWRERLLAALRERADADGSIGLSVEVAYGHGFKPAPRLRADAPVAVSLDDMRAMVRRPRPSRLRRYAKICCFVEAIRPSMNCGRRWPRQRRSADLSDDSRMSALSFQAYRGPGSGRIRRFASAAPAAPATARCNGCCVATAR